MAGLVPAIHALRGPLNVDARHKAGHDEEQGEGTTRLTKMIFVTEVRSVGPFKLFIRFSDGTEGERDFSEFVREEGEMLEPLRDADYFARAFVEHGALTWPNEFDWDPDALHDEIKEMGLLRRSAA